jgi:cysteine sulfinate desulfinase/cysteine desulfurase-like protein
MKWPDEIDFQRDAPGSMDAIERSGELRAYLESSVSARIPAAVIYRAPEARPGETCILLENVNGEVILNELTGRGIKAGTLSPCAGRSEFDASFLARADIPHSLAMGSLLFSLDADNTEAEIDRFVEQLGLILKENYGTN